MKHLTTLFLLVMVGFSTRAMKPETVITITFSGEKQKTIRAHKGDTLIIKFQMASGTGFVWQPSGKINLCKQGDTKYEHIKRNLPGAPMWEVMNFIVLSPGEEDITFVYHRPFEKSMAAAKTRKLHLIVH